MNVKKNPFGEQTPSQRLILQGGTRYDIQKQRATSVPGILFSDYNPVLITQPTLDELISVRGELNFLLIYNLIEKWSQSDNPRTWKPLDGVYAVLEELKENNYEIYEKVRDIEFSAWFEKIPDEEPDFVVTNPPKHSLVINCSSFSTSHGTDSMLSTRLPLGHIIPSKNEDSDKNKLIIYEWLWSNFLIRDFSGVGLVPEQYDLLDSTYYRLGASMLANGSPGVGKSTNNQFAAIELILQHGPKRNNRKLLYFTHDKTQKIIAQDEIKSILRVAYCADDENVSNVENSITFVSQSQMFGSIFPAQTQHLHMSNFNEFLADVGIERTFEEEDFYTYARENFLKIVLGWFGSISKFRDFVRGKTFIEAMNSPVQLFQIHENHTTDGLPVMKMGGHWKGFDDKITEIVWQEEEWKKFIRLLNTITDSMKLRSYENEKGEYWTHSINCGIIDEAYSRLYSSDSKEREDAKSRWEGILTDLPLGLIEGEYEPEEEGQDKSIWKLQNKNEFDAIIIDEVQNFSPICLSVILKHQSNRHLGRESKNNSLMQTDVSPFVLIASGDPFQSMTANTFFEHNRHMLDIFRGWSRFVRDEGSTIKSGTGVSDINDKLLKTNHRNCGPIVDVLNSIYGKMFTQLRRSGKLSKEIEPKTGAEEGAFIDLSSGVFEGDIQQRGSDILHSVVDSLFDQVVEEKEGADNHDITSRNTFLIIPNNEFKDDLKITKNSIMKHIEFLFSNLDEDENKEVNQNISEKLKQIRRQLDLLAGKEYADNNLDDFRYLLLCRGIASVKDVQGLTVEAAIVSGLRNRGRSEFRHLQEAFVAFSRPRKILILLDEEGLDDVWEEIPLNSNISIDQEKVEAYIHSKKGTDFNWFFRKTLSYPYSTTRWKNTKKAITYAEGGYSGILRSDYKKEKSSQDNYESLKRIIECMSSIFTNYFKGKLIETWDNVIQLEELTEGGSEELPKELRDIADMFSKKSLFKLKHFLALQFLHRYGLDEELRKQAPKWIEKLEHGGENSFFEEISNKSKYNCAEKPLYVFFHSTLKLIHDSPLGAADKKSNQKCLEDAVAALLPRLGTDKVASLGDPLIGKGRLARTNLENTMFVGENQDKVWYFPPASTWQEQDSEFHYMPVEGEWSLRPKQIFDSFLKLIDELRNRKHPTKHQVNLCEFAALAYINDKEDRIINLIEKIRPSGEKAFAAIEELVSSPKKHPKLFSYLMKEYSGVVAVDICKSKNKIIQKELQKYKEALKLSSPNNWKTIYDKLIKDIEKAPKKDIDPWFLREKPDYFEDLQYRPEYSNIESVSYSFDLEDQLVEDRNEALNDLTSKYLSNLMNDYNQKTAKNKEDFGEGFVHPTWTDSIIELIDTKDTHFNDLKEIPHLGHIISKLIEDEGLETLDYALSNNTLQEECVSNSAFLWRKISTRDRLEKTVKLCLFLLDYEKVRDAWSEKAKQFLRRTIIAISLYYIQNNRGPNFSSPGWNVTSLNNWEYLSDIWKIITDNHSIDDLFAGKPFNITYEGQQIPKRFGKSNEDDRDYIIFNEIKDHIGFHNWNSLDMSLRKTSTQLIKEIERENRDFVFGKLNRKKGIIWLNSSKSNNFVEQSYNSPRYTNPNLNKYRLGSLPNRPHRGSNTNLVRYQYLNIYTFKLIDNIIRSTPRLEKENCIYSGLIEEWIVQQLNNVNFDKKEIIDVIIQTMQVSRKVNATRIPEIQNSLENLDGLRVTKVSDANKVLFSFEITPKIQSSSYKYRKPDQKISDEIMKVKEKLAEIMAYLPYLAAREDKKLVHSQITIENHPNIKWENLGNEYHEEINPGKAGHKHVFTLIPLNKEDEGLPIMEWYKANFRLIRNLVEEDAGSGNEFMPESQERHLSLFRYNTLPIESPSVHIAAMLDAGKEPTEIEKQLLEYYPSLRLLNSSLILDHVKPGSQETQVLELKEAMKKKETELQKLEAERLAQIKEIELLKAQLHGKKNTESDEGKI